MISGINHDTLAGYVANEHIDWTNATSRILTTLTTEQMRLCYDATHYAAFTVNEEGDLTINPTRHLLINGDIMGDSGFFSDFFIGYGRLSYVSSIAIKPNADTDDYFTFATVNHIPTLGTAGGCNLKITADSGTIDFDNENITGTGSLTAASLITGSDIGIAADTNLIQLTAANTMQINGSLGIGLSPSYSLDTTEVGHSAGDLKIQPDVQGDVALFGDTDVADASDGKRFIINRKAAEGDSYFLFYIDQYKQAAMTTQSTVGFKLQATTGSMRVLSENGDVRIEDSATGDVKVFDASTEGETKEFEVYGYRTGDAKRSLEIGVGVDAADTASFDGLTNYWFDGEVDAQTKFKVAGTQVLTTQQAHIADATTQDIAGTDTVDETKLESDLAGLVSTINSILTTLETHGIVAAA